MNHGRNIIVVLSLIAVLLGGWLYLDTARKHPDTDDAYVGMHVARIAAQVSGPITAVLVRDHQAVKAGDPLFEIDPAPYQIAVERAQAQLEQARQASVAAQARVDAAQAKVAAAEATWEEAERHTKRIETLAKTHSVSKDEADTAQRTRQDAQDQLSAARAELDASEAERGASGDDNANIQAARAALAQAQLNLAHTQVNAPVDGVIGNLDLRAGSYVTAGQALFALVDTHDVWVDANFKETDLTRIRPGQSADVAVDLDPGVTFHGVVESLGPASGAAFALLPPENATGNWVKVTQRFPVRVRITDPTPALRLGASAEVRIDAAAAG